MDVDAYAERAVAAYRRDRSGARLVERKLGRSRTGNLALQALRDGTGSGADGGTGSGTCSGTGSGTDYEGLARAVLADELERDRRRRLFLASVLAVVALVSCGVYAMSAKPAPEAQTPPTVRAERGTLVLTYGSSGDVDGSPIFRDGLADNVPDITMATDSFIATGGASISRLSPGTAAGFAGCATATEASATPRVDGLKPGDVVCVRTSAAAVAAVTVSNITGAGTRQVYQLDIAYWAST